MPFVSLIKWTALTIGAVIMLKFWYVFVVMFLLMAYWFTLIFDGD